MQRTGQSLYSRWGYFIFTVSFILFGLARMASSLNLLVLRLAQFHSENGTAGISALLGRNEEDLIAAAIAHHRASIHIQQRNRIYSNNSIKQLEKSPETYKFMRTYSWNSATSSVSSAVSYSPSKMKIQCKRTSSDRMVCSGLSLFHNQKRRRRYYHLRRPPQNIKHLLYLDHFLDNHEASATQKAWSDHHANHVLGINTQIRERISIWFNNM